MRKKNTNHTSDIHTTTSKKTKKSGVGKVITGLAVGSVVGATVGLLLAPPPEKNYREDQEQAKGIQKKPKGCWNIEDKAHGLEDKAHTLPRMYPKT